MFILNSVATNFLFPYLVPTLLSINNSTGTSTPIPLTTTVKCAHGTVVILIVIDKVFKFRLRFFKRLLGGGARVTRSGMVQKHS